jgi:hypothetical protein
MHANLNMPNMPTQQHLIVNNRILAKVNEKTISVLDVMKKMEVFLNRYYPEYANSLPARHQYFSSQWRSTLIQMIDNELMLQDAEKLELKVSDSEVREAVIERFGPNIMASLDQLQMSYEEARKMVHTDIIADKMTWYRINSKAMQAVNPQDIKQAYQSYLIKNPEKEEWVYEVVSIRTKSEEAGKLFAEKTHGLLKTARRSFQELVQELKEECGPESDLSISLSEEFKTDTKTISDAHKQGLLSLVVNSISEPIRQVSRADQSIVYRIFHLKNHAKIPPLPFSKVSEKLREELLNLAAAKESKLYLEKIREKFGYDSQAIQENIPADFQPFVLK